MTVCDPTRRLDGGRSAERRTRAECILSKTVVASGHDAEGKSMSVDQRTRGRVSIGLILAGGLMILTGASVGVFAFVEPAGTPISLTAGSIGDLLFALVLVAAGVEAIRRRHFLLAFVVPAVLALANLGFILQTGQTAAVTGVEIPALVVVQVGTQRSNFI